MTQTYKIEKLTDFTKVPVDKMGVCLDEFAVWIEIMRRAQKFPELFTPVENFTWIDDTARNITINIYGAKPEEK